MTAGLTRAMRDCLLVIQELTEASGGVAPTFAEIATEMDLPSKSRVHNLVHNLVERRRLTLQTHASRSLHVLEPLPMPEDLEFVGTFDDPTLAAQVMETST